MKNCCINTECEREIDFMEDYCPYCGYAQYDDVEDGESVSDWQPELFSEHKRKREKFSFSDEEILTLGLYPKDETYKMSLISKILGK